ncbi:MAG: ACT domain-containing protein, partial [Candidatus Peribacteraceae bacterium]|nr:ACT domain-containing protein [Candidatus Peribacteraceae bacterium]
HLIVDDVETAKMVLRDIGPTTTTEVLAMKIHNKPGAIANIARMCAGAEINIHHIYATSLGREAMCFLAVDDIVKARKVLK